MSLLNRIFGKRKKEPETLSTADSIQKLRDIEDMMIKKQDFLEKKIETEVALAKKHAASNKKAALQALKRKKQLEKQLQHVDGVLSTTEYQRNALENASMNTEVLKAMGAAARTLKAAQDELNVDKVHDLMDDIAEQQQIADEIGEAISKPVGFGFETDEDDLMKELEALEQEELDKQLLDVCSVPANDLDLNKLPEAPTTQLPARKEKGLDIDDDLAEIKAWAAL
ncbi:hypothetical protein L596_014148 [Steinernema carpocapsae]|uniref:Charged multivesicular body protein 4b n=1 Tax=Steinernema carpocapsae TaxID=34508 RepID=A0A4U5NB59_STECR|nr:hypothetical protein L596_014148 [Steinernema carpocapsae]